MTATIRLKRAIAGAMCQAPVGRLVGWLCGNRIPYRGCLVDTQAPHVTPEVKAALFWGFYESAEARFVRRYLPRDLDVVELGGSMGVVTSQIARILRRGRRIVCVEANPILMPLIERNVRLNVPEARLEIINAAIGYGSAPTVRFHIAERNLDSRLAAGSESGSEIDVPRIGLNDVLVGQGMGEYALVCDIEGAEAGILRHDSTALDRCRFIIAELHEVGASDDRVGVEEMVGRFTRLDFKLVGRRGAVCAFERRSAGQFL